jgi:subtilisin family serine protease
MVALDHLPLLRFTREEPRRKRPGFSTPVARDVSAHARRIECELDAVVADHGKRPRIKDIDPALILKVELTNPIDEDTWRRAGFQILAQNPGDIYVLFASDTDLKSFRARLAEFKKGAKADGGNAAYYGLFSNIERARPIPAEDRIGPRLAAMGFASAQGIDGRKKFLVDVELWDAETSLDRRVRVSRIEKHITASKGEIIGAPYIGSYGLILIRVRANGKLLSELLQLTEVAQIDVPPLPDLGEDTTSEQSLDNVPVPDWPPQDVPVIGIIDSGLNAHPLIDGLVVERMAIPADLGTADMKGHGTIVAGIAAYGDIRECIDRETFAAPVRIVSVRVVNDHGAFDDTLKIPEIMRKAVEALVARGCRVINLSLGDASHIPYAGGRASPWAAELDTLVREHDIVLVVSAGNASPKSPPWGAHPEAIVDAYPQYLTAAENRLLDPAYAANVVTVGSLAHGNGLRVDPFDGAAIRALTVLDDPTPITRSGPGVNGAIKPDFVDYGGTVVYNGEVERLMTGKDWINTGMLSLSPNYRKSLFTADTGTSFAAPRIAYKAGLLFARFPTASASMVRALLAIAASIPKVTATRLTPADHTGKKLAPAVRQCVGYGIPDHHRALASEERRVILVADAQELELDQMALYAVPLPKEFRSTKGKRSIRIALAFDAPVRHTRLEYLGTRMSFYLVRGITPDAVFEHFKRREDKTKPPKLPGSAKCGVEPSITERETSTLQIATFNIAQNFDDEYGDLFHLAVFTHRRWAGDDILRQKYAVAVELSHESCTTLHQSCAVLVAQLQARAELGV